MQSFESTDLAWKAGGRKRRTARSRILCAGQGRAQHKPLAVVGSLRERLQLIAAASCIPAVPPGRRDEGAAADGKSCADSQAAGQALPAARAALGLGRSAGGAPSEGWGRRAYLEHKNQGHRRSQREQAARTCWGAKVGPFNLGELGKASSCGLGVQGQVSPVSPILDTLACSRNLGQPDCAALHSLGPTEGQEVSHFHHLWDEARSSGRTQTLTHHKPDPYQSPGHQTKTG